MICASDFVLWRKIQKFIGNTETQILIKKVSHQSGNFWKKVKPKFFINLDIEVRNHVKFEFANIALRAPNSCQLKIDENKRSITTTIIVMKTLFLSLVAWLGKKQKLREPFSCLFLFSPEIVTEEKVVLSGKKKKKMS